MTGNKPRHIYFALQILKAYNSSLVLVEKQPKEPWGAHMKIASSLMQKHFKEFNKTELQFFQKDINQAKTVLQQRIFLEIDEGEINSDWVIDKILTLNPALLVVLSTSLLKDNFIRQFPKKIINLHAGLSPYYRGSGANIFPFYNKELEYVGMTIHYIDLGIDSGEIIIQSRPIFKINDDTHTIGCKNIKLGTSFMIEVIDTYLKKGPPKGFKQDLEIGKVYYKKDFTNDVLHAIYKNIEEGIVKDYVGIQPKKVDIISKITYE